MKYSARESCFFLFYLDAGDEFFARADTAANADKFKARIWDALVSSLVSLLLASPLSLTLSALFAADEWETPDRQFQMASIA